MHNALLISEVLGCIIDHLVEDTMQHPEFIEDEEEAGRPTLAALARTCRAFSECALNGLWRRLCSLEPFVLCLPTKASYEGATEGGELEPFTEEDWSIVMRYAPRVQGLTLRHDQFSIKVLQSLWFRTTLLLPNLRWLRWVYGDYTAVASIRLLLGPSLVHLYVWLEDGDHTSIFALLESYHTLCPNLRSLQFSHTGRFPHVATVVSRAITRSPNLTVLSCDAINEATLIHIAGSRRLKRLRADLLNFETADLRRLAGYYTADRPLFENLCALRLYVEDLSSITPFLKSHRQPLEEVYFESILVHTPQVFHDLFTALSSATRRRTLRRVRIIHTPVTAKRLPMWLVGFQVLSPLASLNLHKFCFNIRNPISLNDDELVQLVQAWPDLELLSLNEHILSGCSPSQRFPTLRGLLLLLARCPKLRGLGLCGIDAMNIPSLSEDESLIRNMAITRLSVASSPIQEPVTRVAHFLLKYLPSLVEVCVRYVHNELGTDYQSIWEEVDREVQRIVGWSPSRMIERDLW